MKIYNNQQTGLAALPVLLVLTGMIIVVGALIATQSFTDNQTTSNLSQSEQALSLARLGARDALEKVARDKTYTGNFSIETVEEGCIEPYVGCITVNVDSGTNLKIASSTGQVGSFIRKIKVDIYLDDNGLITDYSWQER